MIRYFKGNKAIFLLKRLTLHQSALVVIAISNHQPLKEKKERRIVKYRLRNNKLDNCYGLENILSARRPLTAKFTPTIIRGNLMDSTWLLNGTHTRQSNRWPSPNIFKSVPNSENSVQRCICSVAIRETCSTRCNLLIFTACYRD